MKYEELLFSLGTFLLHFGWLAYLGWVGAAICSSWLMV